MRIIIYYEEKTVNTSTLTLYLVHLWQHLQHFHTCGSWRFYHYASN